jgi:hypothetical protein
MDLLTKRRLKTHVIDHLTALGARSRGDDLVILCPFHNDSNPSLGVNVGDDKIPGIFKCFSCPAHGDWNKLADALRLPRFEYGKKTKIAENEDLFGFLAKELRQMQANQDSGPQVLMGTEDLPYNFTWRGFDRAFYQSLGARFYWDKKRDINFLYLPITQFGKYQGYTICRLDRDPTIDFPKYKTFADTSKCFLLYDQVPSSAPIVLVEGHFDAIRLFGLGIPAMCIFGTENWGDVKKAALLSKCPSKVLLLMDGDEAGRTATTQIFNSLRDALVPEVYYLPVTPGDDPKIDPGNMPEFFINEIKWWAHAA